MLIKPAIAVFSHIPGGYKLCVFNSFVCINAKQWRQNMVSRIKTNALLLVLLAGIATPACAMDVDQNSNGWFGWKTVTGAALVAGAGLAWYLWRTATAKPATVAQNTEVQQVQESDDVVRFKRLLPINQKIEIARSVETYVQYAEQRIETCIREFAQVYCERVKAEGLNQAIERLFAAKDKSARHAECVKIKQLLGLVYPIN